MHLALAAAVDIGGSNAGNTLKLWLNKLVDKVKEGGDVALEAVLFRGNQSKPRNGAGLDVHAANDGLVGIVGVAGHLFEAVGDLEQGAVDVGADLERQGDAAAAVGAGALHLGEPCERLELLFLLVNDFALDFLWAGAGPDGADGDLRFCHVGGELHRDAREGDAAEQHQQDDADGGGNREANGVVDDLHGNSYSSSWPWTVWPGCRRSLPRVMTFWPARTEPRISIQEPTPEPVWTESRLTVLSPFIR